MSDFYILGEDNRPIPADIETWARWRAGNQDRRVVQQTPVDGAVVSTVFLGIDHGFGLDGSPPVLWETMVFHRTHQTHQTHQTHEGLTSGFEDYQERYTSYEAAIAGHTRAVDMVLSRRSP